MSSSIAIRAPARASASARSAGVGVEPAVEVNYGQPVGARERPGDIERVQKVPAGLLGDPPRKYRHRARLALRCELMLEVLQHVITAWRLITKQVHAHGAVP